MNRRSIIASKSPVNLAKRVRRAARVWAAVCGSAHAGEIASEPSPASSTERRSKLMLSPPSEQRVILAPECFSHLEKLATTVSAGCLRDRVDPAKDIVVVLVSAALAFAGSL